MAVKNTDLAGFQLPDITKPDTSYAGGATPQYRDVMAQIQKAGDLPSITQTIMPSIQNLLSPTGQAVSPYANAIKQSTSANRAQTQTDMQKRGLTGSDIEATAMNGVQQTGEVALANLYGQTANQLSSMIYQAAMGDLQNNRDLLMTIAQAMGQELTTQRDMQMFQEALKASVAEAENMRNAAKNAGIGSMLGGLAGAGLGAGIAAASGAGAPIILGSGALGMGFGRSAGGLMAGGGF